MDDLVTWLREQVAEDRRAALACAGAPWVDDVPGMVHVDPAAIRENKWSLGRLGFVASADNSPIGDAYRAHIVRHDPQAVLDLCDAHDALLDAYEQVKAKADEHSQRFVADLRVGKHIYTEEYQEERRQGQVHAGRRWGMDIAVLTVAAAYRRDPGYREEWAPRD